MHNKSSRFLCGLPIQYFLYLPAFAREETQRGQVHCLLCISWLNIYPAAGSFLRCFGLTMVFIDLFFFLLILLIQRWFQKMMCAVGTDVIVEVSKEWFQPTSPSLPFCFQNKDMGCSGAKFDTEWFVQQNETCWSSSHARLNTDFSCYFGTIEAFIFLCNTWDYSSFLGSLSH